MKTIRAKQAKEHFAFFVQRDEHVIIAKHLTYLKVLLRSDVFVAALLQDLYVLGYANAMLNQML